MTIEFFSALISVLSLLGVIASNYYTYKARIDEAKMRQIDDGRAARIAYYQEIQKSLIENYHKSQMSNATTAQDVLMESYMMAVDDAEMQSIAEKQLRMKEKGRLAIIRLGKLINEEMHK
jgi:hypothetical protein